MKFDVVIGNPPYQDKEGNERSTNSADLYAKFVNKGIALSDNHVCFVIPSAWTGHRSTQLKKTLFNEHLCKLDTHGQKWFDVCMNTCWFHYSTQYHGVTTVTDVYRRTKQMLLTANSYVPLVIADIDIVEKVKNKEQDSLDILWERGGLNLNTASTMTNGKYEFIQAVGKKDEDLSIQMIDTINNTAGYGKCKLVLPNMGHGDKLGNIKFATKEQVGGHSVVFMITDNELQRDNLKTYLESKIVRFVIKAVKISTPNAKGIFKFISKIDLTRSWTDAELYAHFDLTQEEIEYVESTVK